jgi:hypothetical protein
MKLCSVSTIQKFVEDVLGMLKKFRVSNDSSTDKR